MAAGGRARQGGRPRGFDQGAVLASAMDLFWRSGYAQVSVPDLSAATGLSTSSIYNAFGSKHALYLATLDRYLADLRRYLLDPLASGTLGIEDVTAFLDRLAAAASSPDGPRGCLITKAIAEFATTDLEVAARTRRYRRDLRAALTAALSRAANLGEIPPAMVQSRATALAGLVMSFNLLVGAGTPRNETSALLAAARTLLSSPI
jgi:TetR/AcrR family transcriptional regulator, transcriptional repressor for nem operon